MFAKKCVSLKNNDTRFYLVNYDNFGNLFDIYYFNDKDKISKNNIVLSYQGINSLMFAKVEKASEAEQMEWSDIYSKINEIIDSNSNITIEQKNKYIKEIVNYLNKSSYMKNIKVNLYNEEESEDIGGFNDKVNIFVFGITSMLMLIVLALFTTIIATFIPVRNAAKKKPVESIRVS
ncbi:MAG: hypothetical protein IJ966_00920 [Bacilli bacterium]|nr:hypothetical protein [Bacilli bacterium]